MVNPSSGNTKAIEINPAETAIRNNKIKTGPRLDIESDKCSKVRSLVGLNPRLQNEHKHRVVSISKRMRKRNNRMIIRYKLCPIKKKKAPT